jgi:acetate kinase
MILTINGGSSGIKFALYDTEPIIRKKLSGEISRIGLPGAAFTLNDGNEKVPHQITSYGSAISSLTRWLKAKNYVDEHTSIGHRVVHGGQHSEPCRITDEFLQSLKSILPYDPDHLPNEIKLIKAFRDKFAGARQFACFDTAFHQTMPRIARLLPIPRRFSDRGIQRYGFHGLSYQYLMQELIADVGAIAAKSRVILCHLGSGASLAAVYQGKSVDTSMGFTPAGGVPMSTRTGDLDPGVAWVMMKNEKLSPKQFNRLINRESGLLGISETSGDMSDLLSIEAKDARAAEAVDLFCYQVKKWIGSFAAVLGGVDYLVFAGGIGENAPGIRAKICDGLKFLGIKLDETRNTENAAFISANEGAVTIRVMHTDEELMIAKTVLQLTDKKM